MAVQPELCGTCSETTLLVFSRDGSCSAEFAVVYAVDMHLLFIYLGKHYYRDQPGFSVLKHSLDQKGGV